MSIILNLKKKAKEMSEKCIKDCNDTIRQLDIKIKKEEQINKTLADKNVSITKGKHQNFMFKVYFMEHLLLNHYFYLSTFLLYYTYEYKKVTFYGNKNHTFYLNKNHTL